MQSEHNLLCDMSATSATQTKIEVARVDSVEGLNITLLSGTRSPQSESNRA